MELKKSKFVEAEYDWEIEGGRGVLFVQLTEAGLHEVENPED